MQGFKGTRWLWLLGLAAAHGALAQQAPLPEDMAKGKKRPVPVQPAAPAATSVEKEPSAKPVGPGGKTITVAHFEFAGNTLYDQATLEGIVKDYENRPVTLLELYEAADRVAAFYAERGYTLASVNVPPQKIDAGTVRLLVSEGRIDRITTEGTESYSTEQLQAFLGGVRPGEVYRSSALEQGLRVINTLPGLSARAVIRPGSQYGTSEVVIKASEDPVSGAFIVDNYGRENIGEFRLAAFGQFNNPLHVADQLQLLALRSEDGLLNYGYVAYSLPVNALGTRLTASYGYASFSVGDSPVDGKNRVGRVQLDHPVLRSAANALDLSLGASRTLSNADITGTTFNGTSISLLEVGATYNHTYSSLAVTQLVTSIGTNFDKMDRDDLDAGLHGPVVHADQRLRAELDIQHLQPIADNLQLFTHLNGVYSPDPLPDTQAYSLGGPDNVRGYPASEVRGDRGYFGSVSLRRQFTLGDVAMAGRVFADSGKVFNVDPLPGQPSSQTLSSIGVGADARYDRYNLKLDWSFPRDGRDASDGRDDSRLFGSFTVSF